MSENIKAGAGGETARVASYIASAKYEDLPPEVVVKAKQHILDTLGAMVAGVRLDAGKLIVEFARQEQGKGECTVIGSSFKASCTAASLANGTLGHADEVDDLHHPSIVHPGCATLPAALALAERERVGGKAFITAVVLGYDIVGRVGRALDARLMKKSNHSRLGVPSCFAAAAAASYLLGLGEEQVCSALGLAAEQACGTYAWLNEPLHMAKAFELGVAGRSGVTAALLAELGFQGPPGIFERPHNIFDTFSSGQGNLSELTRDLGSQYDIMGATIKKYPVGGPVQAPLEGLFQIMREQKLQANDIQEITVGAARHSVWLVGSRPIQDISMQYLIAAGVYYGKLGWEEAHSEEKLREPKVQELRQRVKFVADAKLEKTYPRMRAASVEVITRDGRCHSVTVEHIPGTPGKPFTQAQVEEKFLSLASPVLGVEKAQKATKAVSDLEVVADINKLGDLLRV